MKRTYKKKFLDSFFFFASSSCSFVQRRREKCVYCVYFGWNYCGVREKVCKRWRIKTSLSPLKHANTHLRINIYALQCIVATLLTIKRRQEYVQTVQFCFVFISGFLYVQAKNIVEIEIYTREIEKKYRNKCTNRKVSTRARIKKIDTKKERKKQMSHTRIIFFSVLYKYSKGDREYICEFNQLK